MVLQPTEPVEPRTVIRRRSVSGFAAAICIERNPSPFRRARRHHLVMGHLAGSGGRRPLQQETRMPARMAGLVASINLLI
jgi:hypothetical protein